MSEKKTCAICQGVVMPGKKAVELAGGFFDPGDPEFFVIDDSVLVVSYVHLECMLKAVRAGA